MTGAYDHGGGQAQRTREGRGAAYPCSIGSDLGRDSTRVWGLARWNFRRWWLRPWLA